MKKNGFSKKNKPLSEVYYSGWKIVFTSLIYPVWLFALYGPFRDCFPMTGVLLRPYTFFCVAGFLCVLYSVLRWLLRS